MNNKGMIPISQKYALSISEGAAYFNIGEKKLRSIIKENPNASYILRNGNRTYIKRMKFEKLLEEVNSI